MPSRKISHVRGKGSINHNNRNHIYKNVDESKTPNNIYYAKESLKIAYQKCFGQALENYNEKQKRADRKIANYYTHLFGNANQDTVATSSNKEMSFYEIVVGIGDKNTCVVGSADGELATKILDEYARGFSERNPNFYVFNSVLHLDEKTPHLHIDYIPVADGYKNGLKTRNSQSVALQNISMIHSLIRNPVIGKTAEYNDNRISLYVAQRGKCGISAYTLEIDDIHCHHKKMKSCGGTDEYSNLIILSERMHRLVHTTDNDTITDILSKFKLDKKQISKLNKLRKLVGIEELDVNTLNDETEDRKLVV